MKNVKTMSLGSKILIREMIRLEFETRKAKGEANPDKFDCLRKVLSEIKRKPVERV